MAFTDDFSDGDGPLSADWQADVGTAWVIDTGKARPNAAETMSSMVLADDVYIEFPDDQYAEVDTTVTIGGYNDRGSALVRGDGAGQYYFGRVVGDGNSYILKRESGGSGTGTVIGTGSHSKSAGDPFRSKVTATGTTITLHVDGVLSATCTDSEFTSGRPGMCAASAGASSLWLRFNDFACTEASVIAGDSTPPTITSVTLASDGETLTVALSEACDGHSGLTITPSGGAATLTYVSGDGTDELVFTTSRVLDYDETFTWDLVSSDIEDQADTPNAILDDDGTGVNQSFQNIPDPDPPEFTVSETLPTGWNGTADVVVTDNAGMTAALTGIVQNGSGPYIIQITAGTALTGTYKIPNKTGSQWVIIRTSAYASLPAVGTRVAPADASDMAKITSSGTNPALWFEYGAHNIRFIGIEVTTDYTSRAGSNNSLIYCGYDLVLEQPDDADDLPSYITFDRCYIHGTATGNITHGISTDAKHMLVADCYIADIHNDGFDSQGIFCFQTPGPQRYRNNYIASAGENVIFGGSDPLITNAVPTDIEFINNYLFKPLTWKEDDPSYDGIEWVVKNCFELKNARRMKIQGNIFDGCWPQGQAGIAVVFTPRNQSGGSPWATLEDIDFRDNIIRNTLAGISVLAYDNDEGSLISQRVRILNNLIVCDSDNFDLGGDNGYQFLFASGDGADPCKAVKVIHNTCLDLGSAAKAIAVGDTPYFGRGFIYRDNFNSHGTHGLNSPGGNGTAALDYMMLSYSFLNNAIILDGATPATYPATTLFPANAAAVEFVDYDGGNYALDPGSDYAGAASDNEDIGADFVALLAATANTESGEGAATGTPRNNRLSLGIGVGL